jgi:hypothetical protein
VLRPYKGWREGMDNSQGRIKRSVEEIPAVAPTWSGKRHLLRMGDACGVVISRQSGASMSTMGQTRIFAASTLLLRCLGAPSSAEKSGPGI